MADTNLKQLVRIANVDLPGNKQIRWALTHIKGVGINFADVVCTLAGIDRNFKTGALNESQVKKLSEIITRPSGIPVWMYNHRREFESNEDKHLILASLSFTQDNDLKRLKKIKTLRGVRHIKGLPVRGQRTRSNFRKSKGKVVGVAKKKEAPQKSESKSAAPAKGKK